MEPQTNQVTEVTKTLSSDKKSFIGFLLSLSGVFFLLGALIFFIAIIVIKYFVPDLLTGLIIGSSIVGIASFATGSALIGK